MSPVQNNDKHGLLQGSLTTPPCYESVYWVVYTKPVLLSRAQFKEFRERAVLTTILFKP
jgi:carbonic anhydrase